jgi:non-specific serine/threonine protein kinase
MQVLGMVMLQVGRPEIGRSLLVDSIALYREVGEKVGLTLALPALWINTIALEGLEPQSSAVGSEAQRALLEESLQLARELRDNWSLALALRNWAWQAIREGDHAAARPLLQESLALQVEIGTKLEAAPLLADLAQLAELGGNPEEALELYDRSLQLYKDCADARGVVSCMAGIGGVALIMGDIEFATEMLTAALDRVGALGSPRHSIAVLEAIGRLMGALGHPTRAAVLLAAAQAWYRPHAFTRPLAARAEYNGYLESARAGLDEAAWQRAWAIGEAMSIEDALQSASESLHAVNESGPVNHARGRFVRTGSK